MSLTNFDANLREELRTLVAEIAEKDEIPDGAIVQGPRDRLDDGRRDSRRGDRAPVSIKIDDEELVGFTDLDRRTRSS